MMSDTEIQLSIDECGPYDIMSVRRSKGGNGKPKHPRYCSLALRLRTFDTWPKALPTPEDLATAGFFYQGIEDKCVCYYCGLGLMDWLVNDDPWEEHRKFSTSYCTHLNKPKSPPKRGATQDVVPNAREAERNDNNGGPVPDPLLCKVCFERQMCMTFMPCKHVACCETCAQSVTQCVICRKTVKSLLKIYLQ